jgi:hypothetical protein
MTAACLICIASRYDPIANDVLLSSLKNFSALQAWRVALSRPSSLSCDVTQPIVETSANGYVCKEITEISGYANVAPHRAGIENGSGQCPNRLPRQKV